MITGASSGIGEAAARLFAQQGAAVSVMARREERLRALAEEIEAAGGRVLVTVGDVTAPADVARAVDATLAAYGRVDAAFNNAGWGSVGTPLHETDDADFERVMDVNVRGVWNCLKRQIPVMVAQGAGAIVNTCSTAGSFATGADASYVAAKHAVLGLTRAAAAEYGERGVRVNALMVGSTRTELMEGAMSRVPGLEEAAVARAVQRRLADPAEVARAALWLCGDGASFVTGAAVPVDGGCSAV
ncbi:MULTISPECIES: SDR family NAD(P)-dependent oxidoreductase [Streptomyces]|uniref:SDR family oxidoreductase n=1 Tax=Streptomyces evansiae TaxID=3075535 RepID=A0ABU2QYQ6_9ACTN|nr:MULTISPECIES: SDR family oxidoreductase [unclassified Streptomyces]MDT0409581.1 SDR family oxidoreductase [Streptomyces sp. DSM 41979]